MNSATKHPEYLNMRCCMCPNAEKDVIECPALSGPLDPNPTLCRFVKSYIDDRGWKYRVRPGIGDDSFKTRYQKADKHGLVGWKGFAALPWRSTFDEAQADLNAYAKTKGWAEWNGE